MSVFLSPSYLGIPQGRIRECLVRDRRIWNLKINEKLEDINLDMFGCQSNVIPYVTFEVLYIAPCAWVLCCMLALGLVFADLGTHLLYVLQGLGY